MTKSVQNYDKFSFRFMLPLLQIISKSSLFVHLISYFALLTKSTRHEVIVIRFNIHKSLY